MVKHNIIKRIIIVISVSLLIVLVTFGLSSLWLLNTNYIETGILEEQTTKFQHMADDFSRQITEAEIVLQKLENSNDFSSILSPIHPNNQTASNIYESIDFNELFENENEFSIYDHVTIYTTNNTAVISGEIELINQDILLENWYQRIVSSRRKLVLYFHEQEAFVLYKLAFIGDTNGFSHYAVVNLDLSFLQNVVLENHKILLTNISTNTVVELSGDKLLDLPVSEYFGISESTYLENEMILSYVVVAGSNVTRWSLVIVMEQSNFITEFLTYAVAILSVLFAIGFIIYYRYRFIKKVDKSFDDLSYEKIKQIIENGRPSRLDHIIQNMYLKIEALVKENQALDQMNQEVEAEKDEAEIKALISQINPHYIFNMLNSIHKRALKNNELESAKMIILMSKQLRRSLDWKEPLVTIKNELDHIRSYIELQQYYFGSSYQVAYDLDQTLYENMVPKLILQTLIENALKHGVQTAPFHIKLDSIDGMIRFTIKNDVLGNPKDSQDKIMHALHEELSVQNDDGIGLPNMAKRLRYYYGDDFSVSTHIYKQAISIRVEFPKQVRR